MYTKIWISLHEGMVYLCWKDAPKRYGAMTGYMPVGKRWGGSYQEGEDGDRIMGGWLVGAHYITASGLN